MSDSQYNDSHCMHLLYSWGQTIHHNMCNGGIKVTSWGMQEYALVSILLFSVTAAIVLAGMLCVTAMPTRRSNDKP